MKIEEVFARRRFIMLDGAMGTQLQLRGLTTEQKPELAAFIMPDVLTAVHRDYARAGADILLANTFGANPRKLKETGYTVQQVIEASIACARTAAQETGALVALDIGPIGELLFPMGQLAFDEAYELFAEQVEAGVKAGADAISMINTLTGIAVDVNKRRMVLANNTGGLSGPAVRPVALRMVWQSAKKVHIPIIGMGGIETGEDAAAFMLCGAKAVMVGTANFTDPFACPRIIRELDAYCDRQKVQRAQELVGTLAEY